MIEEDGIKTNWYYIIGDDGCIKSGYSQDGSDVIFDELQGAHGLLTDNDDFIQLDTVYYIEDGAINYNGINFQVELDKDGITPLQELMDGVVIFVHNGKQNQWIQKKVDIYCR